ncbi:hypothetical protein V565_298470 [Rhizoctonia solani 123E]|uniref:Transmembrane protein n=1 Tax=Rhizoctonia solani 123E TaxID=1423351 RepID=A0A074RKN3_9AGAM|nr:hypothetical protein V565_298470 [Rhizoctonia solani 123E]
MISMYLLAALILQERSLVISASSLLSKPNLAKRGSILLTVNTNLFRFGNLTNGFTMPLMLKESRTSFSRGRASSRPVSFLIKLSIFVIRLWGIEYVYGPLLVYPSLMHPLAILSYRT